MNLTPTITYIKNGIEKTIAVTKWNKRKIKKEIYKLTYQFDLINYQIYGDMYTIKDDIEFIHFKNLSFHKAQKIKKTQVNLH